jgi:hypothetical protein
MNYNRLLILIILAFFSFALRAQISGRVVDSKTGEPIPYSNIAVEGKNVGATASINGHFTINYPSNNTIIIATAIGYESNRFEVSANQIIIKLEQKSYEIEAVTVKPRKGNSRKTINSLKGRKTINWAVCGESPWIIAIYFPYSSEYSHAPHIQTVGVLVRSYIPTSKFNLRLIEANDDGNPGDDILTENHLVKARLGKRVINIDLSDKHILFPKNGIFVALEWLMIDENKREISYTVKGDKKKRKGVRYDPGFGLFHKQGPSDTWINFGGKWHNSNFSRPNKGAGSSYPAIELILTN